MKLPEHLVLFDGHCHLCDGSVKVILQHDSKQIFSFASLQSATGKYVIEQFKVDTRAGESIIYLRHGKIRTKSAAALWIANELNFPMNLLSGLLLFPPFIRDRVYDFIARNRYKWFGKSDTCLLPDPSQRHRFIDM